EAMFAHHERISIPHLVTASRTITRFSSIGLQTNFCYLQNSGEALVALEDKAMGDARPSRRSADGNLLYGMLALQMNFVSRDALLAAMQAWVFDKARPLGEILKEQGQLTPERQQALDQMLAEHLKAHGGDAHKSLAAVAVPDA